MKELISVLKNFSKPAVTTLVLISMLVTVIQPQIKFQNANKVGEGGLPVPDHGREQCCCMGGRIK